MWIMAARSLEQIGQFAQAKELRDKVPTIGDSWLTSLSRYDIAHSRIKAGDNIGGQNVLREALKSASGPVQIGLYSLLSASYLKSGQTQMAGQAASKTIELSAQYREAKALREDVGLEYQLERAVKVRDLSQKGVTPADAPEVDKLLR